MSQGLESIIDAGSKLWLDSVDPQLLRDNLAWGATGATSNPIIVRDLIATGRFDGRLARTLEEHEDDDAVAWAMTDHLVRDAQNMLHDVWRHTKGDDGYVSFELDPLLEDPQLGPPHDERVRRYVELGRHWSADHDNRMIKVPGTAAGIDALEPLVAAGVTVNVTLLFTREQYQRARDAVWRGARHRKRLDDFKSVYSIFVSRVDVYTREHVPQLSPAAQGMVGIVNAKRIWLDNQAFWSDRNLRLSQEIVFASTGVKSKSDPADKYIEAFVGSDIMTNPPATNEAVRTMGRSYAPRVGQLPAAAVLDEIDREVDMGRLHDVLMAEGVRKFAEPGQALLELIADKRRAMRVGSRR